MLSFAQLKQSVSIQTVLSHFGLLHTLRRRGDRLIGPCPIHHGDNRCAFVVNCSLNLWHCFTQCQAGGDVVTLVCLLLDCSFPEAAKLLAQLSLQIPPPRPSLPTPPQRSFHPFSSTLALNPDIAFLKNKGILPTTAARFEVGAYRGKGFLEGCIGVRLFDSDGAPLGYLGRRLSDDASEEGKWKCPKGLPSGQLLFNYHRARHHLKRSIVIVECAWGVLRLAQLNIPAVALLGTYLTKARIHMLKDAAQLVLLLDGDEAGQKATVDLHQLLSSVSHVSSLKLPDGCDPDDLNDLELQLLLAPALA